MPGRRWRWPARPAGRRRTLRRRTGLPLGPGGCRRRSRAGRRTGGRIRGRRPTRRRSRAAPRRRRRRASRLQTGRDLERSRRIRRLPDRHVILDQLARFVALGLVVRIAGLVGERHLEIPLGRRESLRRHVRQPGHEELAPLGGGADLLLLVLLQLLLAGLDEAQLLLPLEAADVGEVLGPLHVVAQADVRLVDALVDAPDRLLQTEVLQLVEAVGVVGARLAVVGGLDLVRARPLPDLEDMEVGQVVEALGQRRGFDLERLVHHLPPPPPPPPAPGRRRQSRLLRISLRLSAPARRRRSRLLRICLRLSAPARRRRRRLLRTRTLTPPPRGRAGWPPS